MTNSDSKELIKIIEKKTKEIINPNATIDDLIKDIEVFMRKGEWDLANVYISYCKQQEPKNGYLHYLSFLIDNKVSNEDGLIKRINSDTIIEKNINNFVYKLEKLKKVCGPLYEDKLTSLRQKYLYKTSLYTIKSVLSHNKYNLENIKANDKLIILDYIFSSFNIAFEYNNEDSQNNYEFFDTIMIFFKNGIASQIDLYYILKKIEADKESIELAQNNKIITNKINFEFKDLFNTTTINEDNITTYFYMFSDYKKMSYFLKGAISDEDFKRLFFKCLNNYKLRINNQLKKLNRELNNDNLNKTDFKKLLKLDKNNKYKSMYSSYISIIENLNCLIIECQKIIKKIKNIKIINVDKYDCFLIDINKEYDIVYNNTIEKIKNIIEIDLSFLDYRINKLIKIIDETNESGNEYSNNDIDNRYDIYKSKQRIKDNLKYIYKKNIIKANEYKLFVGRLNEIYKRLENRIKEEELVREKQMEEERINKLNNKMIIRIIVAIFVCATSPDLIPLMLFVILFIIIYYKDICKH